jgi:hypothetical protein
MFACHLRHGIDAVIEFIKPRGIELQPVLVAP